MTFSRRSTVPSSPSALSLAVGRARQSRDRPLLDLTIGNPTAAELPYDGARILEALASTKALVYQPEALGLSAARAEIASDYGAHGITIPADRIAITASTSEAYGVLFKLLCDPGDEVLVPFPSYPLLSWLAAFEGVRLVPYPLVYSGRWQIDPLAITDAITPRTRAIVVVSPNNPTGSYLGVEELEHLLSFGLPIVSDEVFARYPLGTGGVPSHRVDSVLRAHRGLVFALSGLSKLVGLPQLKLGWIAVGGAPDAHIGTMDRLETILDAYLSVGAPVQHALPELLRAGASTADAIRRRTHANLATLRRELGSASSASVLDVEGGWYAIVRVPEVHSDEAWAQLLVEEEGVYVQPGYFFDLLRGAHLVVSLLTPEPVFGAGVGRIAARLVRES